MQQTPGFFVGFAQAGLLAAPQAPKAIMAGAPPGLFQQLLLDAMQGLSGPADLAALAVMAKPGGQSQPAPQEGVAQAPVQIAPALEQAQTAVAEPPPAAGSPEPEEQTPAQTDRIHAPIPPPVQAAAVAAALVPIQQQADRQEQVQVPRQATADRPRASIPDQPGPDPHVERFVQRAVQAAVQPGEGQKAPALGAERTPTFGDLVELVHNAPQQPGRPNLQGLQLRECRSVEIPAPQADAELPMVVEIRPQPTLVPAGGPVAEPAAPERPRPDPEPVMRQVVRSVKIALEGKRSEVQLHLSPAHLGRVAIRLILNEGSVQASITARDASVRAALEANLEQLKTRFAEQGLRVEHVQVSGGGESTLSQFHQAPHDQHRRQEHPGGQHPWHQRRQEPEQPKSGPEPRPSPRTLAYGRAGARIDSFA